MLYIYSISQSSPTSRCLYKNTNSVAKSILERGSQHIFHNAWCSNVFDTSKSPDQLNVQLRPDAFCILPSHLLLSKPFRNTGGYLYNMSVLPSANHFLLIRFTFRWKEIQVTVSICKFLLLNLDCHHPIAHAHHRVRNFDKHA